MRFDPPDIRLVKVTPRKRRVSRNEIVPFFDAMKILVTPRKRRVSRNLDFRSSRARETCHASQEACE